MSNYSKPAADRGSELTDLLGLDPERTEFEAWCCNRWSGDRNALGRNDDDHPRYPGEYTISHVEFAWQAWRASRANFTATLGNENWKLREALTELRDRIKGHPAYSDLTIEEEIEEGGDTAEFSYLARVADSALGA